VNFGNLAKRAGKLLADNSPLVLTAIGVTGTVTTAILTGKASFKASDKLRDEHEARLISKRPQLETKEKVELVWKCYVPAAGSLVMTVACIVTANQIGTRRAAALAAAYSVSEKLVSEYKEKVVETIGANKEQKIRDELAQDRVNRNPVESAQVIVTGDGEVLCYETFTGRYFRSTVNKIEAAQNEINREILGCGFATLTDLYFLLKLPRTAQSDEVGWNNDKPLDIKFSTTMSDSKEPCISIDYEREPHRDYILYR
jgi:hypothetical protein